MVGSGGVEKRVRTAVLKERGEESQNCSAKRAPGIASSRPCIWHRGLEPRDGQGLTWSLNPGLCLSAALGVLCPFSHLLVSLSSGDLLSDPFLSWAVVI